MPEGESTEDGSTGEASTDSGSAGGASTERESSGLDVRRAVFVVFSLATVVGIVLSIQVTEPAIPVYVYVFGFLGSSLYVFTSLARRFDREDRYGLKIASKAVAAFPLAAGVYLLAFAFPGVAGSAGGDRLAGGLAFLAGAYVSTTLEALDGLARRLLGISRGESGSGGSQTGDDESGGSSGGASSTQT